MSTYTNLKLEILGHTAVLTLANPPANTWTAESLASLRQLVLDLNADRTIYSLVVTGEGEKFFSAGAELKLFADGDKGVARNMAELFGAAFETLSQFRGVSIAAINGYAMGGGLECALACDIRIVEEQSQMALPEAGIGLLPCAGGTQLLPRLVGEGWAKRMILCGERVDAQTALRIGLVEQVVAKGTARQHALDLAAKVDKQSPSSVAVCKTLIQSARHQPSAAGLPLERDLFVGLFDTQDQKEGVNAFLQKRSPEWKNA
ncbi:enoyl-CoA hydratase [Herbaspirillum sp. RTI4]|uniref:enoyl-CoA hydratase n=1 Tax=Herbaspirillum sp. RTI4 TaxID=3048640 RepID=UPI002AB3BCA7|nr:enoyl-CoA hydratase [Herbaspirillum sp. RTI4]MDY7578858.1 enoyl-CoA hydratase [Herbaspirillum sp. RTI4]MEA9983001.1 enoyl-CoA hydratase [Herbaspirillum sp. RTI4]